MHIHPQLSLIINNTSSTVPAQIGIDPSLWKDHSLDEFGMQSMPEMKMSAMAPLHTHDDSGIVHVESTVNRNYTLEEFLNIWGLNLDGKIVKMTLNGKPLPDFRDHILSDGEQIKLEVQ
jgi:sulfur carrier protein ThiS